MAFILGVSTRCFIPVSGTWDVEGEQVDFDFDLLCERLPADEAARGEVNGEKVTVGEFLSHVVKGWRGVNDQNGEPRAFSAEGLAELLKVPGVAGLAFQSYFSNAGAKGREKN